MTILKQVWKGALQFGSYTLRS